MSKEDISLVYSFKMENDISYFKSMPTEVQISAECNAASVIYESFIICADQDYLTARLLAQESLPRGFFWAAAQTTEKYLKAFLLLNGVSVKAFKQHPIIELFECAAKIDSNLKNINISPHSLFHIEPSMSHHLKKFTTSEFLSDLETHGSPDNRYNSFGVEYNTGHLCALDALSFHLREKIHAPDISHSLKKLSQKLISSFKENNPWFHPEIKSPIPVPSEEFPINISSSVTKLEFLIKHRSNPAYDIALKWLDSKMKLPKTAKP
ncbi:hypothetical protein [Thauera aromatica]|uniref:hypothetical protein n=1 Tax=Thauera aromatica TaxID=59405 RepID=UPI001FFD5CA9|nr:hypothetical protein [Thauera aromatica]MCK2094769.1 hypothetical protein [Thauera aromatica]